MLEKMKEWMTPERALAMQGIGLGLSQMNMGQAPNLSPVYEALEQRKQSAQMRKVMDVPGILDSFSPQQRAVLATMPESLATQIIMDKAFQSQEPVAGVNVGGSLVNPYTGEVMYAEAPAAPVPMTPQERAAWGIPDTDTTPYAMVDGLPKPIGGGSGAGAAQYGTTLQFYTGQDGKLRAGVLGNDGTMKEIEPPGGGDWAQGVDKVDAGTKWVFYDKRTGEKIGEEAKDLRAAESEKAIGQAEGQATGEAITGLDAAVAKGDQALALIDQISNDPALPSILGIVQGNIPAGTPFIGGGQAGADLDAKIQQLQGQVFLEAFESLKGAGQITEIEGIKAERAKARLQRSQSPEAYRAALAELREVIEGGVNRAKQKAGAGAAPASGLSEDDLKYLGGE